MCKLVTQQEACEMLRISPSTIKRRVKKARAGESLFPIPVFKSGLKIMFKEEDLILFLDAEKMPEESSCSESPSIRKRRIENSNNKLRKLGVKVG